MTASCRSAITARSKTRSTPTVASTAVRRKPDSRQSESTRTSSPARIGSTLLASSPTWEAQNVGTAPGRDSGGKSARQRSERIVTPITAAATAARIQTRWRAPIALRTSSKSSPRTASQPKTTETAMPATATSARRMATGPGSGT